MKKKKHVRNHMLMAGCAFGLALSAGMGVQAADTSVDEAKAQEIALKDAGIEEADAQRLNARYEREDGEAVIEVEFTCDRIEYEYLIREADGAVLEWSVDGRDVADAEAELTLKEAQSEAEEDGQEQSGGQTRGAGGRIAADGGEIIGFEAAKEIVLEDSGISEADAVFTKIKFEYNGRYYDYEVEVSEGRSEYEYTLNAETGEILEAERD